MNSGNPNRVLLLLPLLEDRNDLYGVFRKDPSMDVVAITTDPLQAKSQIMIHRPDVLIVAAELPRMSGLAFLQDIRQHLKVPSIFICASPRQDSKFQKCAMDLGVKNVFTRPTQGLAPIVAEISEAIHRIRRQQTLMSKAVYAPFIKSGLSLIAIGASTGGTEAIRTIARDLPLGMPPIMVVQHMPRHFTGLFAHSLSEITTLKVVEVTETTTLSRDTIYVAQGGMHMVLRERGQRLFAEQDGRPPKGRFKPSVDILFQSIASVLKSRACGVLLTGMGSDGAEGLLAMRLNGAVTLAQDEHTSTVDGMPKTARDLGAATHVLPLHQIAAHLVSFSKKRAMISP